MKYKKFCLLMLCILSVALWSDDLSDKQRQLEKIQNDLRTAETKAAQAETKKKQKESEIQNTRKVKTQTDKELRVSQAEAQKRLNTLNTVKQELQTIDERIQGLKSLQNSQLQNLVKVHRAQSTLKARNKDQHYLSLMAAQTRTKLNELGDVQIVLSEEKDEKGQEYNLAHNKYQQDFSSSKKLDTKVRTLESEKTKLSKEQQQLQNQITKLRKDASQLESLISQLTSQPGKEPASYKFSARTIAWPLKGRIIRSFGEETRSYGTSVICNGIDIAAPEWTSVVAADGGEVAYSGTYGGQGKLVIIDHKNGFFTVYAYNNELLVSTGATVKKGQAIAKSGMTGSASVPSLHFEVRKDGKAVNPLAYLE